MAARASSFETGGFYGLRHGPDLLNAPSGAVRTDTAAVPSPIGLAEVRTSEELLKPLLEQVGLVVPPP